MEKLVSMMPNELAEDYREILDGGGSEPEHLDIVKAADKICAYIKCLEEAVSGNREFSKAEEALRAAVEQIELPEVAYFLKTFVPSFRLTLDELS